MVRAHVKQTPEEKKDTQKKKTPTAAKKKSTEAGSWPCKINGCNKVFAREADLKRHQRTTKSHSVPSFACPQCDATFTRTDALRRHQKSRHNGVIIGPSQSDKDNTDADADADAEGINDDQRSKSPGHAGTPDRVPDEPSSSPSKNSSKDEPSPRAPSISYYRQHTMHPSYGAGGSPLPPPLPPPSMLYDPHYPPPIAMPTSAARLHPWHPVSPPWPLPPVPPASSAPVTSPPSTTGTPASGGDSPSHAPAESQGPSAPSAPPPPQGFLPPPPPGMMYRMPPPYYPYYSHAPMYPYPPPPEYFAHYGVHPGMAMPPYMAPPMASMPYPLPYPSAPQAASSASGSTGSSAGSDEEADGEDDDEAERASSPAGDVPNSVIDPLLASSTPTDGRHASGDSAQEQENATLEAAKVVEVLLKYQSEKNKENAIVSPTGHMTEGSSSQQVDEDNSKFRQMAPPSNVSVGVQVVDVTVSIFDAESIDDPPMLNADELLTQESLASPPPPS